MAAKLVADALRGLDYQRLAALAELWWKGWPPAKTAAAISDAYTAALERVNTHLADEELAAIEAANFASASVHALARDKSAPDWPGYWAEWSSEQAATAYVAGRLATGRLPANLTDPLVTPWRTAVGETIPS